MTTSSASLDAAGTEGPPDWVVRTSRTYFAENRSRRLERDLTKAEARIAVLAGAVETEKSRFQATHDPARPAEIDDLRALATVLVGAASAPAGDEMPVDAVRLLRDEVQHLVRDALAERDAALAALAKARETVGILLERLAAGTPEPVGR